VKRFAFRLDRVLDIRVVEEKEQAGRMADAARVVQERAEEAERCQRRERDAEDQLVRSRGERAPAGTLALLDRTMQSVRQKAQRATREHQEAIARFEIERLKYAEASKRRRSLERLRAHRLEEWKAEDNRRDQRETDEVAARMDRKRGWTS
jgi:flagellar export protein FliJ